MTNRSPSDEGIETEVCRQQRHDDRGSRRTASAGNTNPAETEVNQNRHDSPIWDWQRIHEHLPSAQTVTNVLLAIFTGCLVFVGYVTEQPHVVPRPMPLQNFVSGQKPTETITYDNIGHQPAYSLNIGAAIAVFAYPLGRIHLTDVPFNTIGQDLCPSAPIGWPAGFQQPISESDFDAVKDGEKRLVYVWGTLRYQDFAYIWHRQNFCFTFAGPDARPAGLCSVERPKQYYVAEQEQEPQEPQAQPVPVPLQSGPPN
jgi:hypothetical protein